MEAHIASEMHRAEMRTAVPGFAARNPVPAAGAGE